MDNLNTHQSEQLVSYVATMEGVPPEELGSKNRSGILKNMKTRAQFLSRSDHRLVCHYTPKHASWMNQIEIVFEIPSRKALRHGSFPSKDALKNVSWT